MNVHRPRSPRRSGHLAEPERVRRWDRDIRQLDQAVAGADRLRLHVEERRAVVGVVRRFTAPDPALEPPDRVAAVRRHPVRDADIRERMVADGRIARQLVDRHRHADRGARERFVHDAVSVALRALAAGRGRGRSGRGRRRGGRGRRNRGRRRRRRRGRGRRRRGSRLGRRRGRSLRLRPDHDLAVGGDAVRCVGVDDVRPARIVPAGRRRSLPGPPKMRSLPGPP